MHAEDPEGIKVSARTSTHFTSTDTCCSPKCFTLTAPSDLQPHVLVNPPKWAGRHETVYRPNHSCLFSNLLLTPSPSLAHTRLLSQTHIGAHKHPTHPFAPSSSLPAPPPFPAHPISLRSQPPDPTFSPQSCGLEKKAFPKWSAACVMTWLSFSLIPSVLFGFPLAWFCCYNKAPREGK